MIIGDDGTCAVMCCWSAKKKPTAASGRVLLSACCSSRGVYTSLLYLDPAGCIILEPPSSKQPEEDGNIPRGRDTLNDHQIVETMHLTAWSDLTGLTMPDISTILGQSSLIG